MNGKSFSVLTLGCRVNQYESDCIAEELQDAGMHRVEFGEMCDVVIVNTCTVTAESDRKSRQMIRRAKQSARHIIVTGCYTETARDRLADLEGISCIMGNGKKSEVALAALALVRGDEANPIRCSIDEAPFDITELATPQRTRSYIKIEDGCDSNCSYCIIPKARGHVRSKPIENVAHEAKSLYESGCREVILTGIETAAYGSDTARAPYYGAHLVTAIRRTAEAGYTRIGLGSLDPRVMNEAFVKEISAVPALLPHFHLSIQSGSSSVLARMKRPYNAKKLEEGIERLRNAIPEVTLSADIIVGFPGESEEEFSETVNFIERARFLHLHIFPYSERVGTEAARMSGKLSSAVKSERVGILSSHAAETKRDILEKYTEAHRTEPVRVLVEERKGKYLFGHSEHFAEIYFEGDDSIIEREVRLVLDSTDGNSCFGTLC